MRALLFVLFLHPVAALADEGMWLFNEFPAEAAKAAVGFAPDQAWLDRVRLGSLRLANGCSASFVSPRGLVMTNHHCIRACLEDLATKDRDLLTTGYFAKAESDEERCQKVEANQLVAITDVTLRVLEATKGAAGAEFKQKEKAERARLESECTQGDPKLRCDVVSLFHGARFHLYRYRRLQDVRMVFAPEFSMAAWGGDPDNFNFPRYGFDAAFLRVWEDGKPLATPDHLRWAKAPAKEQDLVFVSGHPGGTERSTTLAQLEFQRDVSLPWSLLHLAELRGRLDEWARADPERMRVTRSRLRAVENGLKALRGRLETLAGEGFLAARAAQEAALRQKAPEPTRKAWDEVAKAMSAQRRLWAEVRLLESAEAFQSELFSSARLLVRHADELKKPNGERLPEFTDAQLPAVRQALLGAAPVPLALDEAQLAWSLARLRNLLGADHPVVRDVLGKKSPEALAAELVRGTKLGDAQVRKDVLEGKALDADPMLAFARKVDPAARALRKKLEEQVDAPVKKASELLAQARREVYGTTGYPDATFTLRLTWGKVQGAPGQGWATTVGQLFARATDASPFALPPTWLRAKGALPPSTPVNVATTNDIIGGNSGSPLLDRKGDVVGLVFDGNLPSLGGRYGYDGRDNRTVAVHGDLILAALDKVYGARRVLDELKAARAK